MLRTPVVVLLLTLLATLGSVGVEAQHSKGRVIMLFGARWCAPCMAEYRDLPILARAAAPDHLILAWVDRPIAPPAASAPDVGTIPIEDARRIADQVGGVGYGLPFSAMFDADGRLCAEWRNPLGPQDVEHLRARCRSTAKTAQ